MTVVSPAFVEIVDFLVSRVTPEELLQFRPSEASQRRVAQLNERRCQGKLSADERSELDDFAQVEHLLVMARADARLRLLPVE